MRRTPSSHGRPCTLTRRRLIWNQNPRHLVERDLLAHAVFGKAAAEDPYEGLPPHMRESRPRLINVQVRPASRNMRDLHTGRMMKVACNDHDSHGIPWKDETCEIFDLDGKQLMIDDRRPSWSCGEREGWKKRE